MASSILTCTLKSFIASEDPNAMSQARAIRHAVFIEEQAVPEAEEWDEFDETATHWLAMHPENGEVIATCRLTDYQQGCQTKPVAKLGRIAVLKPYRGYGIGRQLVLAMLTEAKHLGYEAAYLHGQSQALSFYEKLGFETEGFEFEEAGIPHYAMRCLLS